MEKESRGSSQLTRKIGLFTATSIVVANMIGTGIFTTTGIMAEILPNLGWILLCWLFGGIIAISGALCYAELATRMPEAGGEYVYLKKLYHPALGFLTGWTSFIVGFSAPIAASAMGFAEYTFAGIDIQSLGLSTFGFTMLKKAVAIAVILIFILIHYLGLHLGSRVQNVLTILKIVIISGLACAGLALGKGGYLNFSSKVGSSSGGFAIGTAMILVMFS